MQLLFQGQPAKFPLLFYYLQRLAHHSQQGKMSDFRQINDEDVLKRMVRVFTIMFNQ